MSKDFIPVCGIVALLQPISHRACYDIKARTSCWGNVIPRSVTSSPQLQRRRGLPLFSRNFRVQRQSLLLLYCYFHIQMNAPFLSNTTFTP